MRKFFILICVIFLQVQNIYGQQQLPSDSVQFSDGFNIFFDCSADDQFFECFSLKESLKLNLKYQDRVVETESESNLRLKIRTREVHEGAIEKILIEHEYWLRGDSTPFLTQTTEHRTSDLNDSTILKVINNIVVLLVSQRGVVSFVSGSEGGVTVEFSPDGTIVTEPTQNANWYLEPYASVYYHNVVGENKTFDINLGAEYVISKKMSKVKLGANGMYSTRSITFENGSTDEYQEIDLGIETLFVRTLKNNRWSVAVLTNIKHQPQSNINVRSQVYVGVEYNLVPFVTKSEDTTFSVRYLVGPEYYNLVDVNLDDEKILVLYKHGLELAGSFNLSKWNYNKNPLSLDLGIGAGSEITSLRYASLYFRSSISYNVTERISLTPTYSLSLSKGYPNEPKNTGDGGVIGSVSNAGRFGQIRHYFHVRLGFTFGSSGIKDQDKRWQ